MCSRQSVPTKNANTGITKDHFPFLSLPLEIRFQIYELALTSSPKIPREHPLSAPRSRQLLATRLLSRELLFANHQIYLEARITFYQQNTFLLVSPNQASRWLARIGPINRAYIRDLRIIINGITGEIACEMWRFLFQQLPLALPGLRRLHLYLEPASMWTLWVFEWEEVLEPLGRMPALQNLDVATPRRGKACAKYLELFFSGTVECVPDSEWCTVFTFKSIPLAKAA